MKVLVTGGTGYIGSHTCVELIEKGHEVVIVDNLFNSNVAVIDRIKQITGVTPKFYNVDLLDKDNLEEVFKENNFDAVIHFAGHKAVGESCVIPLTYYQNNIAGSLNLYELMSKYNVKKLVFSSSATVYGDSFSSPLKEEYGKGTTTNPYGATKAMNEIILEDLAKADKEFSIVILRYFNPVGAHPSHLIGEVPNGIPNNLVPYIGKVVNKELDKLKVFGNDYDTKDGTGERDYIHVCDLAYAHVLAINYTLTHFGSEVINVGTGNSYSVLEVIHAYELACKEKIPYEIVGRRPGDIATSFADCTKAYNLLGFKTKFDINQMCYDSYEFVKKNPNGIK